MNLTSVINSGDAMSLAIALCTLPFWGLFAVDLFFDLYLTHPVLGVVLKVLFPMAALSNLVGIVVGAVAAVRKRERRVQSAVGIVLNALPILAVGAVVCWWVFLFRM